MQALCTVFPINDGMMEGVDVKIPDGGGGGADASQHFAGIMLLEEK